VKRTRSVSSQAHLPVDGESTISQINDDGFGIFRTGDREVWVLGAFPGERIRWRLTRTVGEIDLADLVQLISTSPERVPRPIADVRSCMGCPLAELSYPAQLRLKENRVRSALAPTANKDLEIRPIQPAEPTLGYRTTAKLSIGTNSSRAQVGLFDWGTRFVGETTRCPSHHQLVNLVARATEEELNRLLRKTPASKESISSLRHLVVRVSPGSGKVMITFVVRQDDRQLLKTLGKGLQRRIPTLASIHVNLNRREGPQVFGRETHLLWGHPDLLDKVGNHWVLLSPESFFQAHHEQAAWIYALARKWAALSSKESALDLYSGVGGIAMSLAEDAGRVIGIEISEAAARDASRNAERNGLRNCTFRAAKAEDIAHAVHSREAPAVVTLNPPRAGASPTVLAQLAQLAPSRMIYVSCNPETLARDLVNLRRLGYVARRVQPVDMFPQTAHVETVALLESR